MTIQERKAEWEEYRGKSLCPPDFRGVWQQHWQQIALGDGVRAETVPFHNPAAVYEQWSLPAPDGGELHVRYIRPAGRKPFPTVLMFHDLGRGVRGWHHMTRFIALGFAVAALENRTSVTDWQKDGALLDPEARYLDALTVCSHVLSLPLTDTGRLMTWGEGFGGGLALVAAALVPGVTHCAALNPLPGDLRAFGRWADPAQADRCDLVNFAPLIKGSVLFGTSVMDEIAPPKMQYAIYHHIPGPKRHLVYPKYGHERINFFEDELLAFLSKGGI